jgi:hypothetical protein
MSDPRGPYKRFTAGMTPAAAARWFDSQGKESYETRGKKYGHGEAPYVNAKFRCAGFAHKEGRGAHRPEHREWYHQASLVRGNEWGIAGG